MGALNDEIARFIQEQNPVRFEGKFDAETKTHTARAQIIVSPDWTDWGLRFGEAIQNVRSALDHAVWQLVILSGNDPRNHRPQFPICSSGVTYWSKTKDGRPSTRDRDLAGVAEEYRAIIDDAQPYRSRYNPKDHALSGLAYLSNVDKHRVIHGGFLTIGEPDSYVFDGAVGGDVSELIECDIHTGPFQEDTDIVTMRFAVTGPQAHVKMNVQIPVEVAFSERGYTMSQLVQILDGVQMVLDDISTVF